MKFLFYVVVIFLIGTLSLSSYAVVNYTKNPSIFSTIDNAGYIQALVDDIQVNTDSSLDVTETIILQNPDNFQRNLFFRFFPYSFDLNMLIRPKYLINQITLDNHDIIDNNGKVSIYKNYYSLVIFQKNEGIATYTIHYHDYFGIKLNKNEDQFIWQLVNINLIIPINYIEYNITFPKNVELRSYRVLLGTQQEHDNSFVMQQSIKNDQETVRFYTKRSIQNPETFAILIAIKKGIFSSLFTIDNILKYLTPEIYLSYIISILFLFYTVYYFANMTHNKQGYIDNYKVYSPPENLTPPEMAYIIKANSKNLILTYITSLLIKGYFILDLNLKKYIYQDKPLNALPAGEAMISNRLISYQDKELYSAPSTVLSAELRKNINKYYVQTNIHWYSLIVTLCLFILIDYSGNKLSFPKYESYGFADLNFFIGMMCIYIGFFIIFYMFSGSVILLSQIKLPKNRAVVPFRIVLFLITTALILYNIVRLLYYYPLFYLLPLIILTYPNFLCIKYFSLLNTKGRAVYQQILNFKEYLLTESFELSSDEFEKYLPYAIAFNIENEWAEKFKSIYPEKYKPQWILPASNSSFTTLPDLIKSYSDFALSSAPNLNIYRQIKSRLGK
ncbi:MAG: DUF2207 domain-containing protein [Gammaproteobacteria bacterium]|nr:DUF2207 domain-containing protein [Gammaproteobacteria bacterium]